MFFMENGDMCFLDFGETCLDTFEFTLNIEILLESAIANAIAYFRSTEGAWNTAAPPHNALPVGTVKGENRQTA